MYSLLMRANKLEIALPRLVSDIFFLVYPDYFTVEMKCVGYSKGCAMF